MQFSVDAATLAFGDCLACGRLARAMRSDPYVLGYVLARVRGLVCYACADARLARERDALAGLALHAFLGEDAGALAALAGSLPEAARARYDAGADDGRAQCEYLFGQRDVRTHPRYAEAAQRERSAAALMPGNPFNGTPAAVAHQLEHFGFRAYFEKHGASEPACRGEHVAP